MKRQEGAINEICEKHMKEVKLVVNIFSLLKSYSKFEHENIIN